MLWGTAAALVPLIIVGTYAEAHDLEFIELPFWVWVGAIMAILLLPLSFAYAVAKHRVMEIPVLLRRSARYLVVHHAIIVFGIVIGVTLTIVFAWALSRLLPPNTRRDRLGRTPEWRRWRGVRRDRRSGHAARRAEGNRAARSGILPRRVRRAAPVAGPGASDEQRDRSARARDSARRLADRGPASKRHRRDAANVERSARAGCASGQRSAKPRRGSSGSRGVNADGRHLGESRRAALVDQSSRRSSPGARRADAGARAAGRRAARSGSAALGRAIRARGSGSDFVGGQPGGRGASELPARARDGGAHGSRAAGRPRAGNCARGPGETAAAARAGPASRSTMRARVFRHGRSAGTTTTSSISDLADWVWFSRTSPGRESRRPS